MGGHPGGFGGSGTKKSPPREIPGGYYDLSPKPPLPPPLLLHHQFTALLLCDCVTVCVTYCVTIRTMKIDHLIADVVCMCVCFLILTSCEQHGVDVDDDYEK